MRHQELATAPDGTAIAWSVRDVPGTSRTPVVLVHGITESAASWDPVTERLASSNPVITLDLRGHGESARADTYDLASMASDVATVMTAAGAERPHLVGHSLGGAVVTAAGSMLDVASVVVVDQSLQLDAFKEQLVPAEAMLRDPSQYQLVLDAMFESMMGDRLPAAEQTRIHALRRAGHEVVLGAWELLLTEPVETIAATVDAALGGYAGRDTPYLALFGIDPGDGYAEWLAGRLPASVVEVWGESSEYGHYPHLVDPDRFVGRLREFWAV
jgi:pimeloyl-ACP methyl ester carboxylesterase